MPTIIRKHTSYISCLIFCWQCNSGCCNLPHVKHTYDFQAIVHFRFSLHSNAKHKRLAMFFSCACQRIPLTIKLYAQHMKLPKCYWWYPTDTWGNTVLQSRLSIEFRWWHVYWSSNWRVNQMRWMPAWLRNTARWLKIEVVTVKLRPVRFKAMVVWQAFIKCHHETSAFNLYGHGKINQP